MCVCVRVCAGFVCVQLLQKNSSTQKQQQNTSERSSLLLTFVDERRHEVLPAVHGDVHRQQQRDEHLVAKHERRLGDVERVARECRRRRRAVLVVVVVGCGGGLWLWARVGGACF